MGKHKNKTKHWDLYTCDQVNSQVGLNHPAALLYAKQRVELGNLFWVSVNKYVDGNCAEAEEREKDIQSL